MGLLEGCSWATSRTFSRTDSRRETDSSREMSAFGPARSADRYGLRMATWDADAETTHPVDFRLVQNTFVTMFWKTTLLDETIDWLRSHTYRVFEFDAGSWSTNASMYDDVASALHFPEHFGRNLHALNDCMSDVASGDCGWDPTVNTGVVVVLRAFDAFTAMNRSTAQHLLDILARQARSAILIGHRMICLVQSDDPRLTLEPVGATPVVWNDAEWLDSARGL